MAALEIIALDTATPQLRAPGTGDTYSAPRALALTPETLTGSAATSGLSVTQTWNTAGAPAALSVAVTDTASNASSRLADFKVGGTSKFKVLKNGTIVSGGVNGQGTPPYTFLGSETTGMYLWTDAPAFTIAGAITYSFTSTSLNTKATQIAFGSATGVGDVALARVAAGILKVSDGSTGAGVIVTPSRTVSALPAAATAGAGARSFVTDATATTFLSTVAGGGANKVPVVSDGTNWLIG